MGKDATTGLHRRRAKGFLRIPRNIKTTERETSVRAGMGGEWGSKGGVKKWDEGPVKKSTECPQQKVHRIKRYDMGKGKNFGKGSGKRGQNIMAKRKIAGENKNGLQRGSRG